MIIAFIDANKPDFGVEPICTTLAAAGHQIAPSTYYAARTRPRSARAARDEVIKAEITAIDHDNYQVFGARKMWVVVNHRDPFARGPVARCTTERLMRELGISGITRARSPHTTRPAPRESCPDDLVERQFTASAANRLWVADITYVRTFTGWVYVAFILDVFNREIVGWQVATSLYTALALDALNMAIFLRRREGADLTGLVHHSDRGVQYRAIRYTQRLAEEEAVASVGSKGDSYDNAMAEALNSLYKAELIRNKGPWTGIDDVEAATAGWVEWYNTRRPHSSLDYMTPRDWLAAHPHGIEPQAPTTPRTPQPDPHPRPSKTTFRLSTKPGA